MAWTFPLSCIIELPSVIHSLVTFCYTQWFVAYVTCTQSAVSRFDHWGSLNLLDAFFYWRRTILFFSPALRTKVITSYPTISTHDPSPNFIFSLVFIFKLEKNSLFSIMWLVFHYLNTKNLHCLCRYQNSWELPYLHLRTPLREHRERQPLVSCLGWFLDSLLTSWDR